MSTNKTENLHLHAWTPEDGVLLSEFNENFEAIDAAVGAVPRLHFGTYTGTGTYGVSHPNTLTFPFQPQFLLIWDTSSLGSCIIATYGQTLYTTANSHGRNTTTWNGTTLTWYYANDAYIQMNERNVVYNYLIIG